MQIAHQQLVLRLRIHNIHLSLSIFPSYIPSTTISRPYAFDLCRVQSFPFIPLSKNDFLFCFIIYLISWILACCISASGGSLFLVWVSGFGWVGSLWSLWR